MNRLPLTRAEAEPPASRPLRPSRIGLAVGLLVLGAGTALQGIPDLLPDNSGFLVLGLSALGAGMVAVAGWLLENPSEGARAPEEEPALRRRLPPPSDYFTGHADLMAELLRAFDRFPRRGPRRLVSRPAWAARLRRSRGPLAIAVTGEGGTGKSQLVAQLVHHVADRFPDGKLEFQLYGDPVHDGTGGGRARGSVRGSARDTGRRLLRAWLTGGGADRRDDAEGPDAIGPVRREPRRPEDVLVQMLAEIGATPPEDTSLDELSVLWRTATEHRRLLLVLDNAEDFAQVEPLLPYGDRCAVLITSRDDFRDASPHVVRRHLDPLSAETGLRLLERFVDEAPHPLTPDERAVLPDIVAACHGFPLAICLMGRRISMGRGPGPTDLLRHMHDPILRWTVPGLQAIAQSFAFGLGQCEPRERLLLHRLAGAGLTTFTAWSAAALLGVTEDEAKPLLVRMSHRYLVTFLYEAGGFDRYQLHDHVRDTLLSVGPHLLGVPEAERPDWSQEALVPAVDRLLKAFVEIAEAAARRAAPHEWSFGASLPAHPGSAGRKGRGGRGGGGGGGAAPAPSVSALGPDTSAPAAPGPNTHGPNTPDTPDGPGVAGGRTAPADPAAWLETERQGFEICFQWTDLGDRAEDGWRLRRAFSVLCRAARTHWGAMREATQRATALALELGDPFAYGVSLLDRAEVASGHGDHDTGYERALTALYVLDQLPSVDPRWRARAHKVIGVNLYRRGDLDDGRAEIEAAVRIFSDHGDRWWQVRSLCNLAEVDRFQGHQDRAYTLIRRAEELLVGSQDGVELWARVQLQKGEVLRLLGYALHAWFVLDDERDRLTGDARGTWLHARYLRSLGQLPTNQLNQEARDCELLYSPAHERERRRLTARNPRWPEEQSARVAGLFADGGREYAARFADVAPARGLLRRRARLRDTWQVSDQIARLRRAEDDFTDIGDDWGRWRTCLVLGQVRMAQDRTRGKEDMLRAAEGFRALGDKWWHARALRMAAESLHQADRLAEAEELAGTAVEGYRGLRHRSGQLRAMKVLAGVLTHRDLLRAWRTLTEAVRLAEEGVRLGAVPPSLLQEIRDMLRTVTAHGSDASLSADRGHLPPEPRGGRRAEHP
ncbi:NB-ARC domain-containing protein [Nocardiopsis aegyptia]|uniref:Tetratricopeptide (TPR) repeat protein n=1 Tax=Nocardiopsis aegyptia TaxID=220378 RepID=A0A7Z0J9G9_9ACTN|nr:NB-ARC domain-containing protein [Nocardiopsis aegyptia]NYJ33692.1 tetratricopeptide (TPR) repeat protein [Nocardiopsis aegyptia]